MRLLIHVEGRTEEDFVRETLSWHLAGCGYSAVSARLIGGAKTRARRGGVRPWKVVRKSIVTHLKQDESVVSTTMVDYYGLPGDWPECTRRTGSPVERAESIEEALLRDVCASMGPGFRSDRFVPNLVVHEFEALLFSDCKTFGRAIDQPDMSQRMEEIRARFGEPEKIDDSPDTAPSKRIASLVSHYEKRLHGNLAAMEIGVERMREACPHFRRWLEKLESLPKLVAREREA